MYVVVVDVMLEMGVNSTNKVCFAMMCFVFWFLVLYCLLVFRIVSYRKQELASFLDGCVLIIIIRMTQSVMTL